MATAEPSQVHAGHLSLMATLQWTQTQQLPVITLEAVLAAAETSRVLQGALIPANPWGVGSDLHLAIDQARFQCSIRGETPAHSDS